MPGGRGLALVSVCFEPELEMQHLQARSIARHVPTGYFAEIVVVDNTARGLPPDDAARLLTEFGSQSGVVRIVRPGEIAAVPLASGWRAQQVLKLEIARQIEQTHYVVLDAKNHFVRRPTDDLYVAPDGRARTHTYSFEEHPLRASLERALRYSEIGPERADVRRFTPTVTPYVLDTERTCRMMDEIEQGAGRPFAVEFVAEELTEFLLYAAWALRDSSRLDDVFDVSGTPMPIVWPGTATPSDVAATVDRARRTGTPVFSVHRRACGALTSESQRSIADFWVERELFDDRAEGVAFLRRLADEHRRFERSRWRRELPARALVAIRRSRSAVRRSRSG